MLGSVDVRTRAQLGIKPTVCPVNVTSDVAQQDELRVARREAEAASAAKSHRGGLADFFVVCVAEIEREATLELERYATALAKKVTVPVRSEIRLGYPAATVLAVLDEDPTFDLVIMGSRGRTGIKRALVGAVAEKVLRHAPCPVLIVRARK